MSSLGNWLLWPFNNSRCPEYRKLFAMISEYAVPTDNVISRIGVTSVSSVDTLIERRYTQSGLVVS